MPKYDDRQVVSAINSCINLTALDKLPPEVIERFKELIKHKRIGAVCFFRAAGFGLKVFNDRFNRVTGDEDDDNDMMTISEGGPEKNVTDLIGKWVACEPENFKIVEHYKVMDGNARKYYDGPPDRVPPADPNGDPPDHWTSARASAIVMTQEQAIHIASELNGIVIKCDGRDH